MSKKFSLPKKKSATEATAPGAAGITGNIVGVAGSLPVSTTNFREDFARQAEQLKKVMVIGPTPERLERPQNNLTLDKNGNLKGEIKNMKDVKGTTTTVDLTEAAKAVNEEVKRPVFKRRSAIATESASDAAQKWVQVRLTGVDKDGYNYSGYGGRSWVKANSKEIQTWPTKEAAIADGEKTFKKAFKYGKNWTVKNLAEISVTEDTDGDFPARYVAEVEKKRAERINAVNSKEDAKKMIADETAGVWSVEEGNTILRSIKAMAKSLGKSEFFNDIQEETEPVNDVATEGFSYYFGKEAAEKYGKLIQEKLAGKLISKRKDKGEQPGGLVYEAKQLGIDMWDLLEALEGMCHLGQATEIDDSTYNVLPYDGQKVENGEYFWTYKDYVITSSDKKNYTIHKRFPDGTIRTGTVIKGEVVFDTIEKAKARIDELTAADVVKDERESTDIQPTEAVACEAAQKEFTIEINRRGNTRQVTGTLDYLTKYFGYVLTVGKDYQNEPGNSKINTKPANIKSLITNLNNAKRNTARNGDPDTYYTLVEGTPANVVMDERDSTDKQPTEAVACEDTQILLDPKEMLDIVDTLYTEAGSFYGNKVAEDLDKILIKNGADPDSGNFANGLNVPSAYADVLDYIISYVKGARAETMPDDIREALKKAGRLDEAISESAEESVATESRRFPTFNAREQRFISGRDEAGVRAAMADGSLSKARGRQILFTMGAKESAVETIEIPQSTDKGTPVEESTQEISSTEKVFEGTPEDARRLLATDTNSSHAGKENLEGIIDTEIGDEIPCKITYTGRAPLQGQITKLSKENVEKVVSSLESLGIKTRTLSAKEEFSVLFAEEAPVSTSKWYALVVNKDDPSRISQLTLTTSAAATETEVRNHLYNTYGKEAVLQVSANKIV